MPARQRPCGGMFARSWPSKRMRPAVGARAPSIRLNNVVLPAPFGPMMPTASPGAIERSRSSATMIEPKLFFRPATSSSMRCQRAARSGDGLHLAGNGDRRRRLVVGDDDIILAVLEPPLAADERRLGDVLGSERRQVGAAPLHLADDGIEIGGGNGRGDRLAVAIRRALEHVYRDFEQRMDEADWLRPLLLGRGLIGTCEILGAHAGERRLEGMVRRPPDLRREIITILAKRLNSDRKEDRLADGRDLRLEPLLQ